MSASPGAVVADDTTPAARFVARKVRITALDADGQPKGDTRIVPGSLIVSYGGMALIEAPMPINLRPLTKLSWRFTSEFNATMVRASTAIADLLAGARLNTLLRWQDKHAIADVGVADDDHGIAVTGEARGGWTRVLQFAEGGRCTICGEEFATLHESQPGNHPCAVVATSIPSTSDETPWEGPF